MVRYKTVMEEAHAEQIIERSRFIAHVKPVECREDADRFISSIKRQYKDATHNVPAMVIGEQMQVQWTSDDGEPQGTSGPPILHMIVNEQITNIAVVVTRYFGGVKLGTGGLVRAYTGTAKLGIEAARLCNVEDMEMTTVKIEYPYLAKLQNMTQAPGSVFKICDIKYSDIVELVLASTPENNALLIRFLQDLTAGNLQILSKTIEKNKIPI